MKYKVFFIQVRSSKLGFCDELNVNLKIIY
jgi:hypothetical protein